MSVAFWSIVIKAGAPVEVQPPEGYVLNLQQATLVTTAKNISQQLVVKTLAIEGVEVESVIGTLRSGTCDQIPLSLVFGFDVPVTFSIANIPGTTNSDNNVSVHLSGYYQPGPQLSDDEDSDDGSDDEDNAMAKLMAGGDDDDDEDEEEEEAPKAVPLPVKDVKKVETKPKVAAPVVAAVKPAATAKPAAPVAAKSAPASAAKAKGDKIVVKADDDEDEEDDDEEDAEGEKFLMEMIKKVQAPPLAKAVKKPSTPGKPAAASSSQPEVDDEDEDEDEDDEDEEDDDDEDDDDEDDVPPAKITKGPPPKGTVTPSGQKNNNKAPNSGNKTPQGGNPNSSFKQQQQGQNSGSKPQQNNSNNKNNKSPFNNNKPGGNKFQNSGDKRKRN